MTGTPASHPPAHHVALGLRENARQFALLVLVNAFVGAVVGVERSVLPLLAKERFGVVSSAALFGFVAAFGIAKALANFAAGDLAGRVGRRPVLIVGWILALPVPLLLMWAPSWRWVVAANVLLGVSQGLTWSMTVIMKIDLVGPARRGLAMGLNEAAGYGAVALAAAGAAFAAAAYGPARAPFLIALVAALLGLVVSVVWVNDTTAHVRLEGAVRGAAPRSASAAPPRGTFARLLYFTTASRTLVGVHQAGLVNNLNDGVAWALLPLIFVAGGLSLRKIGLLAALYPGTWALAQIATGTLSDRTAARSGRRAWIAGGMMAQAAALLIFGAAQGAVPWTIAAVLLGLGTASVYPTLLAEVADAVPAAERAPAVGTYRLWRDLGYVVGAVLAGALADHWGMRVAILATALITATSALASAVLLPGARQPLVTPSLNNYTTL